MTNTSRPAAADCGLRGRFRILWLGSWTGVNGGRSGEDRGWQLALGLVAAWRAAGDARRRNAVTHRLAEAALGDAAAAEQAVIGLTALSNMFMELYADCAGYPVDSVIRDAAALMYGDPAG